ncbi:uncharacterized protein RSE6_10676 [Rhynchosporium secalis]|uniref:Uncharacterized protein n=1 Tax=Rhynchosporium secalis TaxID=38038 RepID=A0A1E1ML36_RHYSE|nr:uncharacterized protein RSE6_10676 [Rhynchosporium secalis]
MRLLHLLLTVGLAMLVQAGRMSTEFKTHAVDAFVIKDFLIYNIVSTEWRDHSTRLTNRNITYPNHYPPPYNYVQYFAPATFELDCGSSRNTNRCVRPGPIRGIINQITN